MNTKTINVDLTNVLVKHAQKTEIREPATKIPKNRVVTETTKWIFGPDELLAEKQMGYINKMYQSIGCNNVDTENVELAKYSDQTSKFILQQINQKIYGYYSQDLKNKKYSKPHFINTDDVLKLMVECNNMCFYCKKSVQVLYEKVREPTQWTLDRIDNSFGHNKTNVIIACLNCNLRRKTMHTERYVFTKQLNIVKTN